MQKEERLVMVGSTGRNSGKTTFSTEFISKLKDEYKIAAFKVTTIQDRKVKCQRGVEGCGVCTSLEGDYDIREELVAGRVKDTQRLKAAGPMSVYWIRAYPEYLSQAFNEYLDLVPDADLIICESNSLRNYVKPGIFIMIDNAYRGKDSALKVIDYADLVTESLDEGSARDLVENLAIGV